MLARTLRNTIPTVITACLLTVAAHALAAAASAQTYYIVRNIEYRNRGVYDAVPNIHWINKDGEQKNTRQHVSVGTGELFKRELFRVETWPDEKIPVGAPVWLEIEIILGEVKNCRKDGKEFLYHPDGGVVRYKTDGTTLNNNRCQIASLPDDKFIVSGPESVPALPQPR